MIRFKRSSQIIFSSKVLTFTGNFFPYVKLEKLGSLTIKLTLVEKGSPNYETITFEQAGMLSEPISVEADKDKFISAVRQIYEPKCDRRLSRDRVTANNNAFLY